MSSTPSIEFYRDEIDKIVDSRKWRRKHGFDSTLAIARTNIHTEIRQAVQKTEVALGNSDLASVPLDLLMSTALVGLLYAEYIHCAAMRFDFDQLISGCKSLLKTQIPYKVTDPIAFAVCENITTSLRIHMVDALPALSDEFKVHQTRLQKQLVREAENAERLEAERLRKEVLRREEEARLAILAKERELRELLHSRLHCRDEERIHCKLPANRRVKVLDCLGLNTRAARRCLGNEYDISVTITRHSRVAMRTLCARQFEDATEIDNHGLEVQECAICQDDESADVWRQLTCKHMLHELCLAKLLDANPDAPCPMCRRAFRYALGPVYVDGFATPDPRSLYHEFQPLERIKPRVE